MKKLFAVAALGLLVLGSCARKKEAREEQKQEFSAEHMRNAGVDSAALSSEPNVPTNSADSTSTK